MKPESLTLYYKDGSSDKVYFATLEKQMAVGTHSWVVNFAYGRRGSTMTTGTKTQAPVDYTAAKKIYDKAIKDKTAKGYTVGKDGTPFQFTDKESRDSGLHPQLLNSIDDARLAELMKDDEWCMQEKMDGRRCMIRKTGDAVEGVNRLGLTIGLPQPIVDELKKTNRDFVIDGETIGDEFYVFDAIEIDGLSVKDFPYFSRRTGLGNLLEIDTESRLNHIIMVESATSTKSKKIMFELLSNKNKEGVVFKRLDSLYISGRPSSGGNQLKYKFVEDASCVVIRVNDKRSVALGVFESEEDIPKMKLLDVGNTTIPPNHDIPKVGDVVSVRYLYAYRGGSLYQPVYQGARDDQTIAECSIKQLKYRPEQQEHVNPLLAKD